MSSSLENDVKPAYHRKPDPEEPWRYVSPCCDNQVNRNDWHQRFVCNRCKDRYEMWELIDQKTGELAIQ